MLGAKLDLQLTENQVGPAYAICCPECLHPPSRLVSFEFNDKKLDIESLKEKSGYKFMFSLSTIPITISYECPQGHKFNMVVLKSYDQKTRIAFTANSNDP